MGFIQGEGRSQGTLFPVVLDDLIPADHSCRVVDAFVDTLKMDSLGFVRSKPADTGRPGCDPRDLLKLYLLRLPKSNSIFATIGNRVLS